MKYKKSLFLFFILLLVQATTGASAAADGQIIVQPTFTAVVATKNQENKRKILDYSATNTAINSLVIAAFEGKNEVTVKGNGTVSDTVANQTEVEASKWKNFDGTEVKAPAHWTISYEKRKKLITAGRYKLLPSTTQAAGFVLADKSYKGHNDITLENVSIKTINANNSIFANQDLMTDSRGMSETNITFKGTNYLFTDASKMSDKSQINAMQMFKNDKTLYNGRQISRTYIKSEPGSTLNMYTVSGTSKARGIGITQYKDMSIKNTGPKTTTINQTEMDFYGNVNIKVDRGDNKNAENYGVFVGNLPVKSSDSEEPSPESYNRVTFYSNVKVDVQPVLDKDGKQISIGDAFNVDGPGSKVDVKGDGKVQIDGDIHVLNGGKLELNLKNKDSYFHGEAHMGKQQYGGDPDDADNPPNGQSLFDEDRDKLKNSDRDKIDTKLNFTMTNGAHWEATNASKINNFHISNGATVTFGDNKRNINISVENLTGDGTFNMQGDIVKGTADKLIVRKSSEGHHKVIYKDDGSAPTKGNESLLLVEYATQDKDKIKGDFTLKHGTTDQGAYEFILTDPAGSKIVKIPDGNNFYLNPTGRLAAAAQGAVLLNDLIYQSNLTLTESLHQRLGEVHFNKDFIKQKDIWVKYINGEYSGARGIKVGQYTNRYQGLKIGHDWAKERGNWINYNGISLGYIDSRATFKHLAGKTSINGKELGLYSAWLNKENDLYFDFFAKAIKYRGSYEVIKNPETTITSPKMQTFTYILSAETGRRFNLSETAERIFYIQPEAQLAYHATGGYAFKASNGLDIKTEKVTSLIGRIGFRAGLDYFNEKNLHPYIKLMYEREFLGEMQHTFNEVAVERFSNRGSWWVYGFGLSYMNKAKNTQLYFEAQRSSTHNFKQNWQAHLGVRYLF